MYIAEWKHISTDKPSGLPIVQFVLNPFHRSQANLATHPGSSPLTWLFDWLRFVTSKESVFTGLFCMYCTTCVLERVRWEFILSLKRYEYSTCPRTIHQRLGGKTIHAEIIPGKEQQSINFLAQPQGQPIESRNHLPPRAILQRTSSPREANEAPCERRWPAVLCLLPRGVIREIRTSGLGWVSRRSSFLLEFQGC